MITVRNIQKSFGVQLLFENASLQINAGDRYALVGPNGAGKSTLMKMLLGEESPDMGEIQFKRGIVTGYLPQENAPVMESTVLEETLAHHEDPDGRVTAKAKSILMGLGFKLADFGRKVNTLSGGWAMRVAMARLLIQEPDLLMLDEPTNHLDLESLLWFQDYLVHYRGAIFLISHDRNFINTVCSAIISVENHTLKPYYGNYEYFLSERASQK
jgi:ATP-binding cassette, subfamily F, member 3